MNPDLFNDANVWAVAAGVLLAVLFAFEITYQRRKDRQRREEDHE